MGPERPKEAELRNFMSAVEQVGRALGAVGDVPRECLAEGIRLLRTAPRLFCGAVVESVVPALFVNAPSDVKGARLDPDQVVIVPYGWDTHFGGSMTLSVMIQGYGEIRNARAFIPGTDPRLATLKAGKVICVFVKNHVAVQAIKVDFLATPASSTMYRDQWARAHTHSGYRSDPRALFWNTVSYLYGDRAVFSERELLSLGWIKKYAAVVSELHQELRAFKELFRWPDGAPLPERFAEWCQLFRDGPLTEDSLVDFVASQYAKSPSLLFALRSTEYHDAIHAVMPDHSPMCNASLHAIEAFMLGSEMTDCGGRVPVLRGQEVKFHGIATHDFEPHVAQVYWSRVLNVPSEWGSLVCPSDAPADLTEKSPLVASMPRADDVDASAAAADALLEEALTQRKWTIPSGAVVELSIGSFTHVELSEQNDSVEFLLRNAANEFSAGGIHIGRDKRRIWWEALAIQSDESRAAIAVGLYLVLAAVIRDFVVFERRETVFAERVVRGVTRRGGRDVDEPRVVYLPRVIYSAAPDIGRCRAELGQAESPRRAHDVRSHLRRCDTASPVQLFLALRYGVEVPKGYTFVRPHERGKTARDVIYRSRSALQCLYQVSPRTSLGRVAWFEFERDVYRLMDKLGFTVQHVAAAGRGDRGVDVYATKGSDLEEVCWVIQCKAYAARNKVGPGIIRELVGTLVAYPQGTRGMIVTTSGFSSDASTLAAKHNVRLMDGTEFSRLLGAAVA